MIYHIRQEQETDYKRIENIVQKAFSSLEESDHDEHNLVSRIRKSSIFIPELSLVAYDEDNSELIAHIMLSKISIITPDNKTVETLALAPLSVLPEYQNKGIGKLLVKQALKTAKNLGYSSVVVLGHPDYYPKFGFKRASLWHIKAPFDCPDEALMIYELQEASLDGVTGTLNYPSVFF